MSGVRRKKKTNVTQFSLLILTLRPSINELIRILVRCNYILHIYIFATYRCSEAVIKLTLLSTLLILFLCVSLMFLFYYLSLITADTYRRGNV